MKCLAAFSSLPDILYLWTDNEFEQHLVNLSIKNGLAEPAETSFDAEMLQSFAGHFFYPLVTSNKYMKELNNSYKTIKSENGFLFVMNEITDIFIIAVCGDFTESQLFLQRKINFFAYLLRLHYGPCSNDHLKSPYPILRKHAWHKLEEQIETWQTLCQQEQMFLVEALERLHVNAQLNSVSLGLLHEVLMKTNRDGHTVHALLLVNNKLLGLYSNKNCPELDVADILMLIILVKNRFKYNDNTVPKSVNRTPPMLANKNDLLKDDRKLFCSSYDYKTMSYNQTFENGSMLSSSSQQDYHSATSTPTQNMDDLYHTPTTVIDLAFNTESAHDVLDQSLEYDLKMSEADLELLSEENVLEEEGTNQNHNTSNNENENEQDEIKVDEEKDETEEEDNEKDEVPDYFQQCIFLKNDVCSYSPHTAHCLLLDKSTVLIIISQNRYITMATILEQLLQTLSSLLTVKKNKVLSYRSRLLMELEKNINKIHTFFNKNLETQTEKLKHAFRFFDKEWKNVHEVGIYEFIDSSLSADEMNPRLEKHLSSLMKYTKDIFNHLFISTSQRRMSRYEKQLKVILNVRDVAKRRCNHFNEYLNVRGQRNVTMTAYHNDFPGLVHFVYINRNIDQLIAPTINVNTDSRTRTSKIPTYAIIKQYLWDFWQYAEQMVTEGYTSIIIKHGDFNYSYFLWFEDVLGKSLTSQRSLKSLFQSKPPTGILSGTFYKDIIRYLFPSEAVGSVHCYELVCIHVGIVSNDFVVTSCKRLSRLLWEATGEAHSPVNLL